jgi:hypothetical protein
MIVFSAKKLRKNGTRASTTDISHPTTIIKQRNTVENLLEIIDPFDWEAALNITIPNTTP